MFSKLIAPLFGALILSVPFPASGQAPAPKPSAGQPPALGVRKLTGDNEKRAKQLDDQIDKAVKADRGDEAIARAEDLVALRTRTQGPKHFETMDAEWRLKTLRLVAPMPHADRVAYRSATTMTEQAGPLVAQGKYAQAQPLLEKALKIRRRLLTDDHPDTATSYNNLAYNLAAQGKFAQAQPLYEKALEINRRLLTDAHPKTAASYNEVADALNAQGKYSEAQDRWLHAVKSLDAARLRVAFAGLERAGSARSVRPSLAAVLARLGQPAEAWQPLEEDLGRGLLDELAARSDRRLVPGERARLRDLTAALERLDNLVKATPQGLDEGAQRERFAELKRQRDLASIALGEFQTKLVQEYGPLAGQVARLNEIQAALPADAAFVAWVDIAPKGPNAADPDGEHWGVVVRSRGMPAWVPIAGTGPGGLWSKEDTALADRVRADLRKRPGGGTADPRPLVERLRTQRLEPLAKALGASAEGLPPARRLIVLPSRAMAGIPVETLLASGHTRTVSYAPSGTVWVILTQTSLPDPLEQVMNHKPVFDGRLTVREIQRNWDLKAELVTLSACETALGRHAGGEGFVGFTQALLMSGTRSVCLSLWKVDDTATALLMQRFYANLLGRAPVSQPLPKSEALAEAKGWLRGLTRDEVAKLAARLSGGEARSKGAEKRKEAGPGLNVTAGPGDDHPYAHPYYWAAFVLVGDPD